MDQHYLHCQHLFGETSLDCVARPCREFVAARSGQQQVLNCAYDLIMLLAVNRSERRQSADAGLTLFRSTPLVRLGSGAFPHTAVARSPQLRNLARPVVFGASQGT